MPLKMLTSKKRRILKKSKYKRLKKQIQEAKKSRRMGGEELKKGYGSMDRSINSNVQKAMTLTCYILCEELEEVKIPKQITGMWKC